MKSKVRVTVWNEFLHEKRDSKIAEIYPEGIHGAIAKYLRSKPHFEVRAATLEEPEHGLTDQDMVDAIEWQYNRAMAKTAKKDQLPLADWLQNHVENPDSAPQLLRPHLAKLHSQPVPDATPAPDTAPQMASLEKHRRQ